MRVWLDEGGGDDEFELEKNAMVLYLLFANGLDGDVRLIGETEEAVNVLRGLLTGAGSCKPIDAPSDAPLYRPGDECFRQHPSARAFLDPVPRGSR